MRERRKFKKYKTNTEKVSCVTRKGAGFNKSNNSARDEFKLFHLPRQDTARPRQTQKRVQFQVSFEHRADLALALARRLCERGETKSSQDCIALELHCSFKK